jgi:hypothetical protein
VHPDLQTFVRESLARGIERDRIRAALIAAQWRPEEIEAALAAWAESELPVPVPRRRVPPSAGEAFLYLVMFATLYIATFNTGAALFALIERWLPDPVMRFSSRNATEALRGAAAGILIAFPVYLLIARAVTRDIAAQPDKAGSPVRRWLTYLTLFVAALILVADFIVVVRGLLSGELTARFLLKSGVVFAIAGLVFGHFLASLRRDVGAAPPAFARSPWLGRAGAIGVALTLLVTLVNAGSPQQARSRQIDQARIRDLQMLQQRVAEFHAARGHLPVTLEEALTAMPGASGAHLSDPESGVPYSYAITAPDSFTLCCTFVTADSTGGWNDAEDLFWRHPAGKHCFTFGARAEKSPTNIAPPR